MKNKRVQEEMLILMASIASKLNMFCSLLLMTTLLLLHLGCDRNPSIRVYEVPRSENSGQLANTKSVAPNAPFAQGMSQQVPSGPRRFLIAVIPNQESVIFIKSSDTPQRLDGFTDSLAELAKSFRFEDASEKPTWTLPTGWTETPPTDGIAMAKFQATSSQSNTQQSDTQPVDFTVSQLPKPLAASDWPDYFEQNVNRWRRQLGLPQVSLAESQSLMTELPREGSELPAYLIDLRSESKNEEQTSTAKTPNSVTSTSPTSSPTSALPSSLMAPPDASTPRTESKLKYDLPDGWTDEGARGMRVASFSFEGKRDSDTEPSKGEVTVIFAGGDRLANVVRWQGQMAPDKSKEEQQAVAEKAIGDAIDVTAAGGATGQLYTLRGSDDPDSPAMLAAILPQSSNAENSDSSVFVKLTAPAWLADQHQSRLVQFIQSLQW